MAAVPDTNRGKNKSSSGKKSIIMIIGIIAGISAVGVGYMMVYVEPEIIEERVKVIAVTESGCIAETLDGFAVNIGKCEAESGDFIMAPVDQKIKERAKAMNPTD